MPLQIQLHEPMTGSRRATFHLAGSLDTATAPELESRLLPLLDGSVQSILFDLAGLKFISSAGLRLFTLARKRLKERDGQVIMINVQPQVQEVFEIVKALPGVAIFRSMEEFDAYIRDRQERRLQGE